LKLNLPIIAFKLADRKPNLHLCTNHGNNLLSARLLSPGIVHFDPYAVYIGTAEEIRTIDQASLPSDVIVVGEEAAQALSETECNWLSFEEGDVPEIFNAVQQVFDFYNQIDSELYDAVMQEQDIQSLLDICSRFFDNPVHLVDSSLRLIAHSSELDDDIHDESWMEMLSTGYASVTVIDALKKANLLDELNRGREAMLVNLGGFILPYMSANIFAHDKRIVSICVREHSHHLEEAQLGLLDHVATVLTNVIAKRQNLHYLHLGYVERIMLDLIKGNSVDTGILRFGLSQIGWNVEDSYYLLKIIPDFKDVSGGTIEYTGAMIKNLFSGSILLSLSDVLVLIVNLKYCTKALPNIFGTLETFLCKRKFKCGVSLKSHDLSALHGQYMLAAAAIKNGTLIEKDKYLFFYENYVASHILELCAKMIDVRILCHPEALKLYEHDQKNEGTLLYTLYVYLMKEKSLVMASQELNIHRNTLVYRLSKISEIIDADLNDGNTRLHLIFSYEILRYLDYFK
jgi:DNA-binding PucR family transcriptional regulator